MAKKKLLYLASPYTSKIATVREERAHQITAITASIACNFPDIVPFSPITYSHHLKNFMDTDIDWYAFDLAILERFDAVLVVQMIGWDTSYGVNLEIEKAQKHGIAVIYAKPDEVIETLENYYQMEALKHV